MKAEKIGLVGGAVLLGCIGVRACDSARVPVRHVELTKVSAPVRTTTSRVVHSEDTPADDAPSDLEPIVVAVDEKGEIKDPFSPADLIARCVESTGEFMYRKDSFGDIIAYPSDPDAEGLPVLISDNKLTKWFPSGFSVIQGSSVYHGFHFDLMNIPEVEAQLTMGCETVLDLLRNPDMEAVHLDLPNVEDWGRPGLIASDLSVASRQLFDALTEAGFNPSDNGGEVTVVETDNGPISIFLDTTPDYDSFGTPDQAFDVRYVAMQGSEIIASTIDPEEIMDSIYEKGFGEI